MTTITKATAGFHKLEQAAEGGTFIHKLNPLTKTIATFFYVVIVVSFGRYEISGLLPFVFYPVIIMSLGEIPMRLLVPRVALALPFCAFAGLANVFYDREIMASVLGLDISYGMISLFSILMKVILTVTAVLLLIGTTSMPALSRQLIRLKVPSIFVLLINMIYRYISVALEETVNMYTAYSLRAPHVKGIQIKDMGNFVGQLLLRSIDRGERVYLAMKCRGYTGSYTYVPTPNPPLGQWVFMGMFVTSLIILRWFDVTQAIGGVF